MAVDAFGRGTLAINGLVERSGPIQGHAHQSALLNVDVLDTTLALDKLFVVAGLSSPLGMQQRTAVALGAIAIGMSELIRGMHAQAFGAQGDAIRIACEGRMAMLIEGMAAMPS